MGKRTPLKDLILAMLISSALASTLVGVGLTRYVTYTQEEVKSQRAWKEKSVAELLGPMNIQLNRTKLALGRWNEQNLYLEAKVMKAGNETIRDLLLTKGHLIPSDLFDDADKLIQHYDVWLELYEKQRAGKEPDLRAKFTFAAERGFPFPKDAERRFKERYQQYVKELYGPN